MLRDITIGQYYPADSFVHQLDARFKIIVSFIFIISLFIINDFYQYIPVIVSVLMVVKISRVPFKYILKGLKPIMLILIFAFVINIFLTKGEVIFSFWFLDITKEGLHQAFFMMMRLIFLITGTSLLTLTTSPIMLTDGLENLLNPFKRIGLPAHELAMMMTIALRFIPTLLKETDKIMKAQMARGADFESGNIIKRAKSLIPLLVPLFISAFRRADELAMAMEARCYRGGENRTRLKILAYTRKDLIGLIFVGFYIASIIGVKIYL
ncbi:MAG: energy-coupling factor transporter transmembrane component T [Bacillota bacterium]|nr:energy-coupling factor transporter transmembrane component T [Bacillota bacterium]